MTHPTRTTSMLSPLMLRGDMTRDVATTYWATEHAEKVKKLPNLLEYNQRLFSTTDHGFWPRAQGIGTAIDDTWRFDGCAEIRFRSTAAITATAVHAREVYLDEQNVFARVLGHPTGPGGGRWWTDGFDDTVGHHIALLLRRRRGVRGGVFRTFVHERMGAALLAGGARDLRSYTFLPWTPLFHTSPGVGHDNPPQHRYHAVVLLGADSRAAVDQLFDSAAVAALRRDLHTTLTAVHAYGIERTVPVIRMGSGA
ncbi:EthD domain-containing protein [Mycobacterium talmoniae]|uniref:EthD domain-containing protein n=1 Tax=Mycobacterium talmoniae TaxID=1858794 RepID=A0A1S1NKN2_9MYCO|nr:MULTISPECIES: EthD domain-containing protein [Mycobacterium]OHV04439.1 hypothetical protein BKN37_10045 [Mycobacterium talmoniae]PQM48273.1 hypothetical protein C1Y40_01504 [Mycobacterium talmoniae]TDH57028.1 hypothetical protein E2F47_03780 [Mycobacterium eburneum]